MTTGNTNQRLRRLGAVLCALVLTASACGGDSGDESAGSGDGSGSGSGGAQDYDCPFDALAGTDEVVEITLWHAIVGLAATTVEEFADEYNASQDKVRVNVESQGQNYEEQQTKFTAALRDPSTLPQIMLAEDTNTQFMIDSQAAMPAQACIEADPEAADLYDELMPAVAKGYSVEGVQWPAAFGVSTPVIYYNKAHFSQAGLDPEDPPGNLAEIRSAAEAILPVRPDIPPFVYRADAWWLENLASKAGQALVNQNNGRDGLATESELLNDTTSEWSKWMADMSADGLQNTVAYSATFDAYLSMANQQGSMLIETSTAATTIDALISGTLNAENLGLDAGTDLSGLRFPDLDIGNGQLPGLEEVGSGQIGGNAWYMIAAGSTQEEVAAAWDFLKWVNQTPQQVRWTVQGSYLPVFASAEEDPELQAYFSDTRAGSWLATSLESLKQVDPDFPGPVIGPYKEFRAALRTALENSLIGSTPVDESFAAADTEIQAALDLYAEEVGA